MLTHDSIQRQIRTPKSSKRRNAKNQSKKKGGKNTLTTTRNLRTIFYATIIILAIFLLGGGIDFTTSIIRHNDNQDLPTTRFMDYPKMTALSPASMMCYILGFLGLIIIYIGAKRFHQDTEKMAITRFIVGSNLAGWSYFGLELILRIGMEAI